MPKLFSFVLIAVLLVQCQRKQATPTNERSSVKIEQARTAFEPLSASLDAFGVEMNKFDVKNYVVKKNESLYILLQKLDLTDLQIYKAIEKAKKVFEVRSLRPNQNYHAYLSKDSSSVEKMVWEPNKVEYVTFDWQDDSLQISRASRKVTKETSNISGEITSSLYNAIADNGSRDRLVHEMSEIYAWQLDFFNLRKGDTFNIVYEKKFVDGEFYETGKILAVELNHKGESFFAYRFNEGPFTGYYDEEGKSVQKALLKAPFKYDHRISSVFNPNRFHPVLKKRRPHNGVDYAAPYGTPVLSVGDGTVSRAGYYGAAGRMVEVKYQGAYKAKYMHLSKFAKGISSGTYVKQGDVIGYVGNSGRVTGTHLHYGLFQNGRPINPLDIDLPSAKAISDEYRAAFAEKMDTLNASLQGKEKQPVVTAPPTAAE